MSLGLTDDSNYQAIADAIRAKNGETDTYSPEEMAQAILDIKTGTALNPLDNPATAKKIFEGYMAYNDQGEPIVGEALPDLSNPATSEEILAGYMAYDSNGDAIVGQAEAGTALEPLSNPATGQQILSGYEAYDSDGNVLSGTAFLTGGYAEFTLEAGKWDGTTYTVITSSWRAAEGQTPLMDLPYTSSAVNAQRVVESGITMPRVRTSSSTAEDGTVTYTTTIIFSAVTTPPVDVDVAVFNITEVAVAAASEGDETA